MTPRLFVEGKDDMHVIIHVLKRRGIHLDPSNPSSNLPVIEDCDKITGSSGIESLLDRMPLEIKVASSHLAFVVDADQDVGIHRRWQQISAILRQYTDAPPPPHFPGTGYIGTAQNGRYNIGIWMMPDCVNDGNLEHFLLQLISENDSLILHAKSSTLLASRHANCFQIKDFKKALISCWLAWQAQPGKPYGTAILSKYFSVNHPNVDKFEKWFKSTYQIA